MSLPETGPLGVFGGTFDPVHRAHLQLALDAYQNLGLHELVFVPAGSPPLREAPRTPAFHRMAMVERAISGIKGFSADAFEIAQPGPSYTIDTLAHLRQCYGTERPLVLLLGADAFARLPAWHRWRELFALAHIAVAARPRYNPIMAETMATELATELAGELSARLGAADDLHQAPAGRIVPFAMTALDISATAIRERLAQGLDISHLVPAAVVDYIESHQLYRTPHENPHGH
jgi:nicotinate-nucleotide adenylyltransferase